MRQVTLLWLLVLPWTAQTANIRGVPRVLQEENATTHNATVQLNETKDMLLDLTEDASSNQTEVTEETTTNTTVLAAPEELKTNQTVEELASVKDGNQTSLDDDDDAVPTATSAGLYSLLDAMKQTLALGLKGHPLVLRKDELENILLGDDGKSILFQKFFTMQHLEKNF